MQRHERTLATQCVDLTKPLMQIAHVYLLQARLCDRLEDIADRLPSVDRARIMRVRPALGEILPCLISYEETTLLPVLWRCLSEKSRIEDLIEHCRREHVEDCDAAAELNEMLDDMAAMAKASTPDLAGYRLRAFFDALSRHLAWECRLVLPAIAGSLRLEEQCELATTLPRQMVQWRRSV